MKAVLAILLVTFITMAIAQDASKPKIAPFFDRVDDGPAFFVECRNTTGKKRSYPFSVWVQSLRVDGSTVPSLDSNELGPGLTMDVEPGQLWRGIIALRQSSISFIPSVKFGALRRRAIVIPLSDGRHTIAVQCDGAWSEEFVFYWERETQP